VKSSHIKLTHSILSPASLRKMNEWFNTLGNDIVEDRRVVPTSSLASGRSRWTDRLQICLKDNEEDLNVHWTETEVAISEVILSSAGPDSIVPPDPVVWICAVTLFSIAKDYGFGPLTAWLFVHMFSDDNYCFIIDLPELFENVLVSPVSETQAVRKFRDGLNRSGHTCWSSQLRLGDHDLADMYSSAYSMLMDTSEVPVIGCNQVHDWPRSGFRDSECNICRRKDMLNDLLCSLDDTAGMSTKISPTAMAEEADRLLKKMVSSRKTVLTHLTIGTLGFSECSSEAQ
jgi:hypothetical protein